MVADRSYFGSMHVAAHADSFAAKRMRKIGQRRAVDYTSTVVRYMQVMQAIRHNIMYSHPCNALMQMCLQQVLEAT